MKRILLVRHGESQHNASGDCLSGVTDVPLTEQGRSQAVALKGLLSTCGIGAAYSSPLGRAQETARLALPDLAVEMRTDDCLIEFDYGIYEGTPSNELSADDPIADLWRRSPGNLVFPEGGSISDHAHGALLGLLSIAERETEDVIACFSHKTTIRLIVAGVLGLPLDYFRRIPCENASVTALTYGQGELTLVSLNIRADSCAYRGGGA